MSGPKVGIWLIGAWGHLGTAIFVTLAGLLRQVFPTDGLVTEQPEFAGLELMDWSRFVLGGHEIRKTSSVVEARNLFAGSTAITAERFADLAPAMTDWDRNVRTGTLLNCGPAIENRASTATLKTKGESPRAALRRLSTDFEEFRRAASLESLIVVNIASSESAAAPGCRGLLCSELLQMLANADRSPIPTSALYAVAAMQSGASYLNFARSLGSHVRPLEELALQTGSLHMGREGRSDLASVGLLKTPPAIEQGPGRESLQKARTVLDVCRLCEREHRRKQAGVLSQFACFFERPMGDDSGDIASQLAHLRNWIDRVSSESHERSC
jgi:myo-inositol-1-phosphate synthase